jgi:hypothetical protein
MQVLIIYHVFPCQGENHYTTTLLILFLNMSLKVVDVSLSARHEHISATIMDKQLMASKRLRWCETICLKKEAKIVSYHVHHTAVPLESNSPQILSKQASVTKPPEHAILFFSAFGKWKSTKGSTTATIYRKAEWNISNYPFVWQTPSPFVFMYTLSTSS